MALMQNLEVCRVRLINGVQGCSFFIFFFVESFWSDTGLDFSIRVVYFFAQLCAILKRVGL